MILNPVREPVNVDRTSSPGVDVGVNFQGLYGSPVLVANTQCHTAVRPNRQALERRADPMSNTMRECEEISATVLEALYENNLPCGGVAMLRIPPCGSSAQVVLDRRNTFHPCEPTVLPSDFKCMQCHDMWLNETVKTMVRSGFVVCADCRGWFDSITDFARYLPL